MFDENGNPIAQGPEAGAAQPDNKSENALPGVQARIDELTAKFRQAEDQLAAKDAQITAILASIASGQGSRNAAQEPAQPPVEIDPDEQKKLDYLLAQRMGPLQAMIERLERTQVAQQFQQYEQQVPPEVLKRSQELQLAWARSGKQGWVPQDALTYAYGEYNLKAAQTGQARQAQHQYNQAASNVTMQSSAPPASQASQSRLPKNIDSLPLQQRLALYEQHAADLPWDD